MFCPVSGNQTEAAVIFACHGVEVALDSTVIVNQHFKNARHLEFIYFVSAFIGHYPFFTPLKPFKLC